MVYQKITRILAISTALISLAFTASVQAGVALGATRVVYPSDQKQVSLAITNSDDKGFLIQSWIEDSTGHKDGRFVITPPLYLMQGKRENTLRIIDATNNALPKDRESLFWINVKAIPSLDASREKENTLQIAISSRIKLFYRPLGLTPSSDKAAEQLRFSRQGNKLIINNPTPYYLTLTDLKVGSSAIQNIMVPPKDNITQPLPANSAGEISYKTINDYGALTPVMKGVMQ